MRVPCDLDLGGAEDRDEAEPLYAEQAAALRDALVGADTVLDIWREPLEDLAGSRVEVDRRIRLDVRLPAPPAAAGRARRARAADRRHRRLRRAPAGRGPPADGDRRAPSRTSRACTRCPTTRSAAWRTSWTLAADHAREMAERLGRQEASVERFLELSGDDFHRRPALASRCATLCGRAPHPCPHPARASASSSSSASSLLLARGLTGSGAERAEVLERPARPGARRRRRRPGAPAGLPPRAGVRAGRPASASPSCAARAGVQILTYDAVGAARAHAQDRHRAASRGAPATACRSSSACACAATGRSPAAPSSCSRSPAPIAGEGGCAP